MTIIRDVLIILRDKLEGFLQSVHPQDERWVHLGNAGLREGHEGRDLNNKMIMSLIGLQNDATAGNVSRPRLSSDDRYYSSYPPLNLDATMMLSANFTEQNYSTGLAVLSSSISALQQNPLFTHADTPGLPEEIDRLAVDFVSLDLAQMGQLLTATGSKYMPMACYRIRRIPFAGPAAAGVAAPVLSADPPRATPGRA